VTFKVKPQGKATTRKITPIHANKQRGVKEKESFIKTQRIWDCHMLNRVKGPLIEGQMEK